jgi:thioredoxin reductase
MFRLAGKSIDAEGAPMSRYDVAIVGAGPGGLACAIKAQELDLSYVLLEKGKRVLQGIIDTYPKGKKVYPTIPKVETEPFLIEGLAPSPDTERVEEYVAKVEAWVESNKISIQLGEDFQNIEKDGSGFTVVTRQNRYEASNVILAFGSNIPVDLGVYGEAKTVARGLDNPEEFVGAPALVLGGGNAAADVVAALSKAKREAGDNTTIWWGHRREQFRVDKDVARDLGEEILLGGNIRILPGTVPRIGEVDADGVDRLIIQTRQVDVGQGVQLNQGMSFPMKHVIACVGTQGPAPVFRMLGLQQITCVAGVCKISREGTPLIMLTPNFETGTKGIFAIGGAVSPAYILIEQEGVLKETKHSNVIYMAIKDGVRAVQAVADQRADS